MNFKTETDMRNLADIEHDLQALKNIKASLNVSYYSNKNAMPKKTI